MEEIFQINGKMICASKCAFVFTRGSRQEPVLGATYSFFGQPSKICSHYKNKSILEKRNSFSSVNPNLFITIKQPCS